MSTKNRRVLVLGGGFGGVKAALELANHTHYKVMLVSDNDDFRYYPALYRTATGASQLASEMPLAEIFAGKDVEVIKDKAVKLDRDAKKLKGASGKSYNYDILIVALGVVTNYFGIKGLQEYSYGIKSIEEARRLRNHLHKLLLDEQKPDLNYVVIGGGPTGVELAGALPAYLHRLMRHHGLKDRNINVDLIEAESRLMPRMPQRYSSALLKRLRKLKVKVYLNQRVQAETADSLMVNNHPLASHTVIWTAGVTNHPFLKDNGFSLNEHGKALVDDFLQAGPNIFVIGDNADTPYSGMAQTALYDGEYVAKHLLQQSAGKTTRSYKPKKPVYITPVGHGWAAVLWGKFQIYSWTGWLLRSAADFMGYRDLEPWWRASRHWAAGPDKDLECPLCSNQHV
jgi:NADH dehydrogenase